MARIAIIALMLLASVPARAEPAQPEAPPPAASPPADTAAPPAAAPAESNPPAPAEQNPAPPPAAGARAPSDADLRESVCLMIESSARAQQPAARILRAGDLAGEPVPARRGRPAHAQRRARPGHRPVHAAHRGGARAARSVRPGAGAAEIGRVPARARRPVRQSRAWRRRPTMPARSGCATGSRAGAPCRRRRRNYVLAITGISADEWARSGKREPVQPARPNCTQLMALLHRAPNPFVQKLEERVNIVAGSPWGVQLSRRVLARPCAVELRRCWPSAMPRC